MYILGFDIGGTKCAVTTALWDNGEITLLKKEVCPTDLSISPFSMIEKMIEMADGILDKKCEAIGISCGGPLDCEKGIIMSPPNLPGWDNIPIVDILYKHYGVPVKLQNDANACAVAEWKFGAGKGTKNMVFLTFGTGLGAGLIIDGKLYSGTNSNAGEVGHIRLEKNGPIGFGKPGSFEGFCSGGGIAQLGYSLALKSAENNELPLYCKDGIIKEKITAKAIADAALLGDKTALEVYRLSGEYLGKGLSIIIDILNPEAIVLGGIFTRSEKLLIDSCKEEIQKEALYLSANCCKILPAALGENIGDYAAIATATL